MFSKAIEFLGEVRAEVKKVTWPTRREAMSGTAVVVFVVLLMALFLHVFHFSMFFPKNWS